MAARIPAQGRVTVSLRKSIMVSKPWRKPFQKGYLNGTVALRHRLTGLGSGRSYWARGLVRIILIDYGVHRLKAPWCLPEPNAQLLGGCFCVVKKRVFFRVDDPIVGQGVQQFPNLGDVKHRPVWDYW